MSVASHVEELRKKHQSLSQEVETAQRRPGTHTEEITRLKKEKLRLKDKIDRLSQ